MNLKQLELKRLRELLGAVRKGRHMAHGMRTPVARLVRFDKATASGINRALAKWEVMGLREPIEAFDRTFGDGPIEELQGHAVALAKIEKKILTRIAKAERDPLLRAPASEVRKSRQKREVGREKADLRRKTILDERMAEVDAQAQRDFDRLEADGAKHPRSMPKQWLMQLEALKRSYRARDWPSVAFGIRLIGKIGTPSDTDVLSTMLARSRDVAERKT